MKHIVIFASGSGSNAENIILHFKKNPHVKVAAVFSNNAQAGVLDKAKRLDVPTVIFIKEALASGEILEQVNSFNPDLIVLAGFLLKFPDNIITAYPKKIINIHPALLPKYGGKGMYGMHVHRAVVENKEPETGISIHYVDEHYDEGDIIFQQSVPLDGKETCEEVSQKIQRLEQEYFPKVIEKILNENT